MMRLLLTSFITCLSKTEFRFLLELFYVVARTSLGWTFRGSAYCQLIREQNKGKRLEWCQRYKEDEFVDVIWMDKSTIQLENHRRFCCRKIGQAPKPKHGNKLDMQSYITYTQNIIIYSICELYCLYCTGLNIQ